MISFSYSSLPDYWKLSLFTIELSFTHHPPWLHPSSPLSFIIMASSMGNHVYLSKFPCFHPPWLHPSSSLSLIIMASSTDKHVLSLIISLFSSMIVLIPCCKHLKFDRSSLYFQGVFLSSSFSIFGLIFLFPKQVAEIVKFSLLFYFF
jgi:hypothetical protein